MNAFFFRCVMSCLVGVFCVGIYGAELPKTVARPLQPFLVELLAQERGNWKFTSPFGATLVLEKPVELHAAGKGKIEKLGILLEDPEFPGELDRAEWKEFSPASPDTFQIAEPNVAMTLQVNSVDSGITARATKIKLDAAKKSRWNFVGLYLLTDGVWRPLELNGANGEFKLLTDRVGSVFQDGESVNVTLDDWSGKKRTADLTVFDYATGKKIQQNSISMTGEKLQIPLDIKAYGCFKVVLNAMGKKAELRITRILVRNEITPEKSVIGMNIFQQQHWYYSYQLPLFAADGVRWVRPWLAWENTWSFQEPQKGEWNTGALDATLRRLAKYGQKYEYILYNFPSWLVAKNENQTAALNDSQRVQWLSYVDKIVKHCSGKVDDFEIWNEPDLMANNNRKFSAKYFSDFTKMTAAAIRKANPEAKVHILSHSRI